MARNAILTRLAALWSSCNLCEVHTWQTIALLNGYSQPPFMDGETKDQRDDMNHSGSPKWWQSRDQTQFSDFLVECPAHSQPEVDLGQACWLVSSWFPGEVGHRYLFPLAVWPRASPFPSWLGVLGYEEAWAVSLFSDLAAH